MIRACPVQAALDAGGLPVDGAAGPIVGEVAAQPVGGLLGLPHHDVGLVGPGRDGGGDRLVEMVAVLAVDRSGGGADVAGLGPRQSCLQRNSAAVGGQGAQRLGGLADGARITAGQPAGEPQPRLGRQRLDLLGVPAGKRPVDPGDRAGGQPVGGTQRGGGARQHRRTVVGAGQGGGQLVDGGVQRGRRHRSPHLPVVPNSCS